MVSSAGKVFGLGIVPMLFGAILPTIVVGPTVLREFFLVGALALSQSFGMNAEAALPPFGVYALWAAASLAFLVGVAVNWWLTLLGDPKPYGPGQQAVIMALLTGLMGSVALAFLTVSPPEGLRPADAPPGIAPALACLVILGAAAGCLLNAHRLMRSAEQWFH